jgi:hypothetical protein
MLIALKTQLLKLFADDKPSTLKVRLSTLNSFINKNKLKPRSLKYFITNVDTMLELVKKYNIGLSSKKRLLDIMKKISSNNKTVYIKYQTLYNEIYIQKDKQDGDNKPSRKEEERKTDEYNIQYYRKNIPLGNKYKINDIIFNLYIHTDLVMRNEPRTFIVMDDSINEDKSKNYIDITNGLFILNDYKTAAIYGRNTYKIENDLLVYIKKYIKENKINIGERLISNRKGNEYPTNKWSEMVSRSFIKKSGKQITTNDIRKLKKRYLIDDMKILNGKSYNDQQELLKKYFMHGREVNEKYYNRLSENKKEEPKEQEEEKEEVKEQEQKEEPKEQVSNLQKTSNDKLNKFLEILKLGKEQGLSKEEIISLLNK